MYGRIESDAKVRVNLHEICMDILMHKTLSSASAPRARSGSFNQNVGMGVPLSAAGLVESSGSVMTGDAETQRVKIIAELKKHCHLLLMKIPQLLSAELLHSEFETLGEKFSGIIAQTENVYVELAEILAALIGRAHV